MAKGPYCRQPAGKRTEHLGEGRCWLHGGSPRITHGKYSRLKRTDLADAIAEQEENPAIYDTTGEIAGLRAIIIDYINRYDDITQMLEHWHLSFHASMPSPLLLDNLDELLSQFTNMVGADIIKTHPQYKIVREWYNTNLKVAPKPTKLVDIGEVYKMLGEVTKMVERVGKLNSSNAVSRRDFVRIMTEIGNIIDQSVVDEPTKAKIRGRIGTLRLA